MALVQSSVLALEDSGLDVDQVENLIKFCPTKEEMEVLKVGYCNILSFCCLAYVASCTYAHFNLELRFYRMV